MVWDFVIGLAVGIVVGVISFFIWGLTGFYFLFREEWLAYPVALVFGVVLAYLLLIVLSLSLIGLVAGCVVGVILCIVCVEISVWGEPRYKK